MNKALFTSKKDDWATPQILIQEYKVTYDPCPLFSKKDGLKETWRGRILLNPPFSNQRKWVEKAIEQIPNVEALYLLLPARTDTKLFHELLYNKFPITFLKGRLKFGGSKNSAPFPSMIVTLKT